MHFAEIKKIFARRLAGRGVPSRSPLPAAVGRRLLRESPQLLPRLRPRYLPRKTCVWKIGRNSWRPPVGGGRALRARRARHFRFPNTPDRAEDRKSPNARWDLRPVTRHRYSWATFRSRVRREREWCI